MAFDGSAQVIAHSANARLVHQAIERRKAFAKRNGIKPSQDRQAGGEQVGRVRQSQRASRDPSGCRTLDRPSLGRSPLNDCRRHGFVVFAGV